MDKLNLCTKHHTSYVTECHQCYREKTECEHGMPFDSECKECEEQSKLYGMTSNLCLKVSDFSIGKVSCKESLTHPLKNKASKHYELWNELEVIELIEKVLTKEELIGACKFNILKYRLRIGNKDDAVKELQKIKDYENYLSFLECQNDTK